MCRWRPRVWRSVRSRKPLLGCGSCPVRLFARVEQHLFVRVEEPSLGFGSCPGRLMYMLLYVSMHASCVCACMHICTCTHACMHACMCVGVCVCVCLFTLRCTYAYSASASTRAGGPLVFQLRQGLHQPSRAVDCLADKGAGTMRPRACRHAHP